MWKKLTSSVPALFAPMALLAQEEGGLDERIDQAFGNATGWFVEIIFYQIPVAGVPIFWVLFPLILVAKICASLNESFKEDPRCPDVPKATRCSGAEGSGRPV